MRAQTRLTAALAGTVLLVLTGCGGTTPAPEDSTTGPTVSVATIGQGQLLVGANGYAVYIFDPDNQGPSTCYGGCSDRWPALTVTGAPTGGDGVDASLLGTTTRDDGTTQVTYGGWPLYYYGEDTAPGVTGGQGVNDIWWVIDPQGQPVRS